MDRLIKIIKDKHLFTWKDGELTGEGVGEYKLFFEHNGKIVVMSELDDNNFESIEYYMKAYDKGEGVLMHLNFMPRAFEEGAAYYYSARGNRKGWSNQVVAWSQLELIKNNVTEIMKGMQKPYLVISAEKAWSRPSSTEIFEAVPHTNKQMVVLPEASHFDLYDLEPYVSQTMEHIVPFFEKNLWR